MKKIAIPIVIILVVVILVLLIVKGNKKETTEIPDVKHITMDEVVEVMEQNTDYVIVDVRTASEYAEGHIPNAINIPNESIGTEEISELPDKDQMILVYCRSGNRSKQAAEKLHNLGYTDVTEFGGIIDWKGEIVTD